MGCVAIPGVYRYNLTTMLKGEALNCLNFQKSAGTKPSQLSLSSFISPIRGDAELFQGLETTVIIIPVDFDIIMTRVIYPRSNNEFVITMDKDK